MASTPNEEAIEIKTAFGTKTIIRRVGPRKEYFFEMPNLSASHGGWWTLNPQRGYVPVPSNCRALQAAIQYG